MAFAGKNVVVEVSDDDLVYNTLSEINDMSGSFEGDNIDVSVFGTDFIKRIQGLKDGTWSLSGFYDPTDTTGQIAVRNAWLNDTELWIRVKPTPTEGFKQEVKVASIEVSAAVDGAVEVSIELEGTGVITIV